MSLEIFDRGGAWHMYIRGEVWEFPDRDTLLEVFGMLTELKSKYGRWRKTSSATSSSDNATVSMLG